MFGIIIPAFAGALVGFSFSGLTKKRKIIRLKAENKMLNERNDACSNENVLLLSKIAAERDKTREMRRDLLMWERLADEIVKHKTPEFKFVPKIRVPEMGIQLLNYYKEKNTK
jgi:hypothetical protein